jgi:hypothetical protein
VQCKGPCKAQSQSQGSDGDDAALAARCHEDARRLLGALSPSTSNKNNDATSPLSSKEDAHDPPTRR